jgi:hypothetical protein
VASDVTSLTALAEELLATAVAALTTTDAGAPALQYLSPAPPVFDCCPAVMVHVDQLSEESTSPTFPPAATGQRDRYGRIIEASLVITAIRCAAKPVKGSVSVAEIQAVAAAVQQDAWALWNGVSCAVRSGTFKDLCSYVHYDRARTVIEQGGCVGWQMTVRAQIDGIECIPGT